MKDVKNAQYQRLALRESCLRMQTERGFLFKLILPSPAAYAATSPKGRGFTLALEHYIYSIQTVQNNKTNSLVDFSIPIVWQVVFLLRAFVEKQNKMQKIK